MTAQAPGKAGVAAAIGGSFVAAVAFILWWPEQGRPLTGGLADSLSLDAASAPTQRSNGSVTATEPVRSAASGASAGSVTLSLETVGEIALPDGDVERVYRVRVVNDDQWRPRVEAQLLGAGAGATVVEGRAELGDLAPGSRMLSADTVTLRHDPDLHIESTRLQWRLSEIAGSEAAGTMLSGAANELAINALVDYDSTLAGDAIGAATRFTRYGPASPGMSAVIGERATVEQLNAALRQTGTVIVQMHPGSPTITLRQSRPSENEPVQSVANRLQASGVFEWVRPNAEALADPAQEQGDAVSAPDAEPELDDHSPR